MPNNKIRQDKIEEAVELLKICSSFSLTAQVRGSCHGTHVLHYNNQGEFEELSIFIMESLQEMLKKQLIHQV
jgi:hypothetical protein